MGDGVSDPVNEAYRRGQYDMRKRIEKLLKGWHWSDISATAGVGGGIGTVPIAIRHRLKIRALEGEPSP